MTDTNDRDNTTGKMISCGYRWIDGTPYMAPGHNSVLLDDDGKMYLVSHIREMNFLDEPEPSTLQIRQLYLTPDEWLVASAQPYAGEVLQKLSDQDITGFYERICLTPSIPQGVQCAHSIKLLLNHSIESGSVKGTWELIGEYIVNELYLCVLHPNLIEYTADTKSQNANTKCVYYILQIHYGKQTETLIASPAWDWERSCPTIMLSGLNDNGICTWYKKRK